MPTLLSKDPKPVIDGSLTLGETQVYFFGESQSAIASVPISICVANIPNFKKLLPSLAQYLKSSVIIPDASEELLIRFEDLMINGKVYCSKSDGIEVARLMKELRIPLNKFRLKEL